MVPDVIERETRIDAPVERVWDVLTGIEHLGAWFGDAGAEGEVREGSTIRVRWAEHGAHHLLIEELEAPHRFVYRWAPGRLDEDPTEGTSTRVVFTLTPDQDGTLLRVVEQGFASLAVSEQQRAATHQGNSEGWPKELGHLTEYLARVAV